MIPTTTIEEERAVLTPPPILTSDSSSLKEVTPSQASAIERFVAAFSHESNIKWMLFVGAAIVTVCSLKLVAQQWDAWSTTFKFLSILVYVAAIHGFAEASDKLLGLRSTSAVLRILTLILLPISFFSLPWLSENAVHNIWSLAPLLVIGAVFASVVSDRIFKYFLLGRQWTFQAAYLALTLAGAIPGSVGGTLIVAAAIWLVGTVGIVKVNRHVFWLTEQHRKPLLFGFFPILLLGTQMVVLFATKLDWLHQREWLGFGLVLCSVPIMLTARTVANVYKARTGGLLATLPAGIAIPVFVGLVTAASGVVLSFTGFRLVGATTYAVVPTTLVAAILAWVAARDSRHAGFTWISIVLMLIAYQAVPTLVSSFAKQAISVAATTLAEERLPLAFYGLTYLPLLLGWMIASRSVSKRAYLSKPLQIAATCLTLILLPISLTHFKAAFLIPVVHAGLFLAYANVWKDRRYVIPFCVALTIAVGFLVPFSNSMFNANIDLPHVGTCLGLFGCMMLLAPLDRWFKKIPIPTTNYLTWPLNQGGEPLSVSVPFGVLVMVIVGGIWLAASIATLGAPLQTAQMTVGLTVLIATWIGVAKSGHYIAGFILALVVLMISTSAVGTLAWASESKAELMVVGCVAVSILGYLGTIAIRRGFGVEWHKERCLLGFNLATLSVENIPSDGQRVNRTRRLMACLIPFADLATLLVAVALGWQLVALFQSAVFMQHENLRWCGLALMVWLGFAISVTRSRIATAVLVGMVPLLVSSALQANSVLPSDLRYSVLIWAFTSTAVGVLPFWFERRYNESRTLAGSEQGLSLTAFVPNVCSIWLASLAAASLIFFSAPVQLASLISLAGLVVFYRPRISSRVFAWGAIWANVVVLMLVLQLVGVTNPPDALSLIIVDLPKLPGLTVLFLAVILNGTFVRLCCKRLDESARLAWFMILRTLGAGFFCETFFAPQLNPFQMCLVTLACILLAIEEFWVALKQQEELHVWGALAVLAACIVLLFAHEYVPVLLGPGLVVVVAGGIACQWLGVRVAKHESLRVASRPMQIVGAIAPTAVACYGVVTLALQPYYTEWVAMAIFMGGFSHAYLSWTTGKRWHAWLALAMVNIGIANINRSLGWFDLQLYLAPVGLSILGLLELMKREVPQAAHKPIRLVGAMCILVSPVFEILDGSWWHMFSLMLLSVLVVWIAIGIRVRILMYTGIAFLLADLLAMLVWSAIDNPGMLWVSGLGLGLLVIAIAAVCEVYRERLLSRMRTLSSELASWN